MSDDGGNVALRDPWPSYMQTLGIFTKDVGLPGTFALVLLYVVVRFLPAQTMAVARTTAAVQRTADAIGQQTQAIRKLADEMEDHRRWSELRRAPDPPTVGP